MTGFEKPFLDDFCSKLKAQGWEQINSQKDLLDYSILKDIFKRKIRQLNRGAFNDYNEERIFNEVLSKLSSGNDIMILGYIKHGVTILLTERKSQIPLHIKLIDYENKQNNIFNFIREQTFIQGTEEIRGDIVLFINGIPLVILEGKDPLKISNKKQYIKALEQLMRYQYQVKDVFKYIQIGIGVAEKSPYIGTFPKYELKEVPIYSFWKENKEENIYFLIEPYNLIHFLKYYIFFAKDKRGNKVKLIARYNQYWAAEKAIKRIVGYQEDKTDKNKGLIWHWQGSGKTYTMFFIANYYMTLYQKKNPLVFFVIDRVDLETQFDTVLNSIDNLVFGKIKVIDSIEKLDSTIKSIQQSDTEWGLKIVTIHKFNPEKLDLDISIEKKEVLFLIDEAHRTQYGDLASTMRKIFSKSMFFGFTGTPVFVNEKNTFKEFSYPAEKETFLDVYFMKDSQDDGFTLPFAYRVVEEGKAEDGIKILLNEDELKALVENFTENYDQTESVFDKDAVAADIKSKLQKNINKIKIFLSNEKRIEKVVKYIAQILKEDTEDYKFKAMIVAVNRVSCVEYKKYFDKYFDSKEQCEVVMTYKHDETEQTIIDFRSKLFKQYDTKDWDAINKKTIEKFLKKPNPQVLIVTDMLLTGFDAPELKVMYLDKPIYYHRLLQAIARVNRPAPDKEKGVIVDSVGLLSHINKTMSMYNSLAAENEEIKKDLINNLLRNSKEEVGKLKKSLAKLKKLLISDSFKDKDCDIDIDKTISQIKDSSFRPEELKQKISNLSLVYEANKEIGDAIKEIKRILKVYRSLGAEPDKLDVLWEIKILLIIYYTFVRFTNKGRPSTKAMWDALIDWIHQSTIVRDLLPKISTELNPRTMNKVELKKKGEVGSYYHTLRNEIQNQLKNPLYVEILTKLEKIRGEWVTRNIGLSEFLDELKKLDSDKEKLDRISKKKFEDRIVTFVKQYFKKKFQVNINPETLIKEVSRFSKHKRVLDRDRQEINLIVAKMLIIGLPKDIRKKLTMKEIRSTEKEMTEFIISEIKK